MRVRRTVENTLKGSGTEKRGGETRILKKRGWRWGGKLLGWFRAGEEGCVRLGELCDLPFSVINNNKRLIIRFFLKCIKDKLYFLNQKHLLEFEIYLQFFRNH